MRSVVFTIILIAIALVTGALVAQSTLGRMLLYFGLLVIFMVTFIKAEWGLYILIFSMLLSPEFVVGDTARSSLSRGVTLRLEDLLLVVIGLSWFARNAVLKDIGLFLKTPLNKPILFYMIACVLATGFGVMAGRVELKTGALYVLKYFEYFIVFFMMVNHVRNRAQVKRFVLLLFLTAFIVAVIGMLQIPGGERISAPFEGEEGEPNTLGGYLLFIGMMAAGLATKIKDRRMRYWLLFFILCLVPPFLFTQSRSSYFALIPAGMTLALMTEKRVIIVFLVSVALLLSPLFLPSAVKQRILFTFNQPHEADQVVIGDVRIDTSTSARLQSYKNALRDFQKHPILGHGVTGYAFLDAQFPLILVETGLFGIFTFLYLLYSVFRLALRQLRDTAEPYHRGLITGFIAGFVGLMVHAIGANTFIIVRIMEPFWFFVGIITVLPMLQQEAPVPAAVLIPHGRQIFTAARRLPMRPRLY